MNEYQILTLAVSVLGIICLPLAYVMVRALVKWARVETKLEHVVEKMDQLVHDKDKTHQEIVDQMREDRKATNSRLEWLEHNLWGKR